MLAHKVSRERIGTELDGMLNGPDPVTALDLLRTLGLFEAVFEVHPSATEDVTSKFAVAGSALGKAACRLMQDGDKIFRESLGIPSADMRRETLLASVLLPLRCALVPLSKTKMQSMSAHIVKDSLKWKTKDASAVDLLHSVAPDLLRAYQSMLGRTESNSPSADDADGTSDAALRISLGRAVKKLKNLWPAGVIMSSLVASRDAAPLGIEEAAAEMVPWAEDMSMVPAALTGSLEGATDLGAQYVSFSCRIVFHVA